ncbi:MAG: hypothetical protein V3V08_03715 [Nannocystaceae bacterium]
MTTRVLTYTKFALLTATVGLASLPANAATRTVAGTICQSENDRQKVTFNSDGAVQARSGQRVELRCPLVLDNEGGGEVNVTLAVRKDKPQGRNLTCTLRSVDTFGGSFQRDRVAVRDKGNQLASFDSIEFVEGGTVFLDCRLAEQDKVYLIEYSTDSE